MRMIEELKEKVVAPVEITEINDHRDGSIVLTMEHPLPTKVGTASLATVVPQPV
jgi:hypothetical protein